MIDDRAYLPQKAGHLLPLAAWLAISASSFCQQTPQEPRQAPRDHITELVQSMSLEEKVAQLGTTSLGVTRLNVTPYNWWTEALHGDAFNGTATVFPEPIGLGATFDPALVHDAAVAIAEEVREKYRLGLTDGRTFAPFQGVSVFAPNVNIVRDPRWGRGQETYGEDPYLTARMAVAYITGLQGDDPEHLRVAATVKHFAVHSGPESLRHVLDPSPTPHDLADTYLPAFRAAVIEARAAAVMCAYSSVDGEPACANKLLDEQILRGKWHFTGQLVSDCDAIRDISAKHHFVRTESEAIGIAFARGVNLVCGGDLSYPVYETVLTSAQEGFLKVRDIDRSVVTNLLLRERLGVLGSEPPPPAPRSAAVNSPAHAALALRTARESIVLLKNNGILPLAPSYRSIAVIGPLADHRTVLYGNYNGIPAQSPTILESLQAQMPAAHLQYEAGADLPLDLQPVEREALRTPTGETGIQAEYFSAAEPEGTPRLVRIEDQIKFDQEDRPPSLPPGAFSIRYTGTLHPRESGLYDLGVHGDRSRLLLDGRTLVDDTATPHGFQETTVPVRLEAGRSYTVQVDCLSHSSENLYLIWQIHRENALQRAVAAAQSSDLVIAVVGLTSLLESEESTLDLPGFKGGDRDSLGLPPEQQRLLEAVKATGKPLVVVLLNGSALAVPWAKEHADAILEAWYPGQAGGTAIAETLAGTNNPSGRLPITFYASTDQLPPFSNYSMANRTYRYFRGKPLYPFGYGLSYSTFRYGPPTLLRSRLRAGDPLDLSITVQNSAGPSGREIAGAYLQFPHNSAGAPLLALRGFSSLTLGAGATGAIHLHLRPDDLAHVDASGNRVVTPGTYRLWIGSGQPGTDASGRWAEFRVSGNLHLPD